MASNGRWNFTILRSRHGGPCEACERARMTDSISPIRRNAQRAVLIAMLMVVASSMAVTTKAEPMPGAAALAWTAQKAVIDFAAANGGRHLRTLVEDAHDKTILYLDWTMRDAARSGLFEKIRADG